MLRMDFTILKYGGGYCVSNSIYFIMSLEKFSYDENYINYEVDFNTILQGINDYKNTVHVLNENRNPTCVNVAYYKNISIDDRGNITVENKDMVSPFADFNDYYTRLSVAIEGMAKNASDEMRSKTYGMVTTVSKGYDAPCCAAIAKKCGCDTAITFEAKGKYKDDSGVDIAKSLGFSKVIEVDPNEYLNRSDMVEVEYICSGELGAQISFSSFDSYIKGNICMTGDRGDSVWGKHAANNNDEFSFQDMLSHLGSCERRLWLDYISCPMPLYGASSWTSIYRISNSDEMTLWSTNNNYDRPIPRRIIEEAGVQREMFGIEKHGAGFIYKFDWMKRIISRMSPTTAYSFQEYVKKHKKIHLIKTIVFFWKMRGSYLNRFGIRMNSLTPIQCSKIANPMATSLLIPWAGEVMVDRYNTIIGR